MRNISTALVVIGLLAPGSGHPLGIGDIKLHSYLNQPLNAEVPLVLSGEQLSQLRIGLAAPGEFAKVGLERSPTLSKLRFEAVQRRDGSFAVRVRSIDVISEPYLSFLMELTWPEGRMLRSFTLLLDPPDVLAPPSRTARPEVPYDYSESQARPGEDRLAPPMSTAPNGSTLRIAPMGPSEELYGPVGRNEKLWKIAERLKPDPSVSTQEMMMALFRLNPRAFSRPSVNALNAGAYLRIPGRDEISNPSLVGRPVDYAPPPARNGQLSQRAAGDLPRPEEPPAPPAGVQSGPDASEALPTAARFPRPAENPANSALEKLRRENEQIRMRLVALEHRVTELTRLLEERKPLSPAAPVDLPATTLPGAATVPAPIAEETPVDSGSPSSRDTEVPARRPVEADDPAKTLPAAGTNPGTTQTPDTAVAPPQLAASARVAAEPTVAPAEVPARTRPATASEPAASGESKLLPWLLGLSALLCASLVGVALRRRLMNSRGHVPAPHGEETPEGPSAKWAARSAPAGLMNPAVSEPQQASTPVILSNGESPELVITPPEPQDEDALFEADIYLSYGKYRQAEEAVKKAIELAPNRPQHYLKLLEIYKAAKDADAFVQLVAGLEAEHRISSPEFWQRVAELQRGLDLPAERDADDQSSPGGPDATDRLIAKLKQFSLENHARGPDAPDTDAPSIGQLAGSSAAPAAGPDPRDDPAPDSVHPQSTNAPSAIAPDADNLIPYEPQALPREEPVALDCNVDAARSIEDLLKELSAMHFEEHLNAAPHTEAAQSLGMSGGAPSDERDGSGAGTVATPPDEEQAGETVPDHLEAKLDLARAYADMSDEVQARAVLNEVIAEGSPAQRDEAQALLSRLG